MRFRKLNFSSLCLILLLLQEPDNRYALSQSYGSIVTDRPDITESAVTVPKYHLQAETGFDYQYDKQGSNLSEYTVQDVNLANTLIRFGVTKKIELRITGLYTSQTLKTPGNKHINEGLHGLSLGTKLRVAEEYGNIPDISIIAAAILPQGPEEFAPEKVTPYFKFCAAHSLGDQYSFGYNLGAVYEDQDQLIYSYSASLGREMSANVGAFLEIFGEFNADGKPVAMFDGGFTYQLQRNIQLDISAGKSLNKYSTDWFIGAGLGIRLPR